MPSPEQSISEGIAKNGFRILSVSNHKPPFAYSVGLMFTERHPELIIFGLGKAGPDILQAMVKLIRNGCRFEAPDEYNVLGIVRVAVRPVHATQHELYLGYAMGYCRVQGRPGELKAAQVFWPDNGGRYPFDRECEEKIWRAQPRLDQPIGPAEFREWRSNMGR